MMSSLLNKRILTPVWLKRIGVLVMTVSLSLQVGCLSNPLRLQDRALPEISTSEIEVVQDENNSDDINTTIAINKKPTEVSIQYGTDRYLGQEKSQASQPLIEEDKGINLNFKDMDLQAFIQAILGDALQENYVIDPAVSGKVTIQTVKPLPREDLLGVMQEVLALNGATMMLNKGRYRVVPLSKAAQMPVVSRVKRLQNQGYGLQLVPLQFISATEMAKILQPTMKNNGVVYTDKRRNMLILSGSEVMLSSMIDMIRIFDVDWLAGKSIQLFPLRYVDAKVLAQELEAALDGSNGELFEGVVKLVPIERVNGILVVSHTQQYMREVSSWIKRLDTANDKADKRLFVYQLKNTKAADIAAILTNIFDNKSSNQNTIPQAQVAPNQERVLLQSSEEVDFDDVPTRAQLFSAEQGISLSDQTDIRIIADEVNNALVIMGTSREYEMVESAIQELDVMPKQVLIEATIVEVTLNGDLSLGVEWFFKNGGIDSNKSGQGQFNLGVGVAPGFSYSLLDGSDNLRFVLNALESETNVQVLSSPSVMVMDNKTAQINVGDEIPVPTRQSNSNIDPAAPTVNEIQYRNTGILLSVSPRINAGGLVTLDISQEVSDAVQTQSSEIDAPTIQQRTIESSVAVQNGQSVILGGLIRNTREDSVTGVPLLSRLPGLGHLFSQTENSDRRTELLIALTPYVISNPSEAQAVTEEYRSKMTQPVDSVHYQY